MNRAGFLKRALLASIAARYGHTADVGVFPVPIPPTTEVVVTGAPPFWPPAGGNMIIASGGLCAPLAPYYELVPMSNVTNDLKDTFGKRHWPEWEYSDDRMRAVWSGDVESS